MMKNSDAMLEKGGWHCIFQNNTDQGSGHVPHSENLLLVQSRSDTVKLWYACRSIGYLLEWVYAEAKQSETLVSSFAFRMGMVGLLRYPLAQYSGHNQVVNYTVLLYAEISWLEWNNFTWSVKEPEWVYRGEIHQRLSKKANLQVPFGGQTAER